MTVRMQISFFHRIIAHFSKTKKHLLQPETCVNIATCWVERCIIIIETHLNDQAEGEGYRDQYEEHREGREKKCSEAKTVRVGCNRERENNFQQGLLQKSFSLVTIRKW